MLFESCKVQKSILVVCKTVITFVVTVFIFLINLNYILRINNGKIGKIKRSIIELILFVVLSRRINFMKINFLLLLYLLLNTNKLPNSSFLLLSILSPHSLRIKITITYLLLSFLIPFPINLYFYIFGVFLNIKTITQNILP